MEKSIKIALINLTLLILLFGFLFRVNLNMASSSKEEIKELDSNFREDIADLSLEIANIKQSMTASLIPVTESILKAEKQSEQLLIISHSLEEREKELTGLKETLQKITLDSGDLSIIIQDSIQAVVSIKTDGQQGTGFFINKGGYILTNAHLLKSNTFIQVNTFDHKTYSANLIGIDVRADIALLKLKTSDSDFPILELGNSDDVFAGDNVAAIGNPGGYDFSVAKGVISSTERENKNKVPMFQMDISINPGNSGGPLINSQAKVVGMNTGFTSNLVTLERLGFAIKSNYIQKIINSWLPNS